MFNFIFFAREFSMEFMYQIVVFVFEGLRTDMLLLLQQSLFWVPTWDLRDIWLRDLLFYV